MFYVISKIQQPLALNVNDGSSLHLFHNEVAMLDEEQLKSVEIYNHLRKRNIAVFKSYKFNNLTNGTSVDGVKDPVAFFYEYTGKRKCLNSIVLEL